MCLSVLHMSISFGIVVLTLEKNKNYSHVFRADLSSLADPNVLASLRHQAKDVLPVVELAIR